MNKVSLIEAIVNNDKLLFDQLIIESEVNEVDSKLGYTPLHLAAQNDNLYFVRKLIEKGADVNAKDKYGNTPLFKAVYFYKGDKQVINELLKNGANAEETNNSGVSPKTLANSIANSDLNNYFK